MRSNGNYFRYFDKSSFFLTVLARNRFGALGFDRFQFGFCIVGLNRAIFFEAYKGTVTGFVSVDDS